MGKGGSDWSTDIVEPFTWFNIYTHIWRQSWPLPSQGPKWLFPHKHIMKVNKTSYLSMLPN
jgi:hypothetical protein